MASIEVEVEEGRALASELDTQNSCADSALGQLSDLDLPPLGELSVISRKSAGWLVNREESSPLMRTFPVDDTQDEEEDMLVRLTYETTCRSRVSRSARGLLTELHEGQHWSGGVPSASRPKALKWEGLLGKPGYHGMQRTSRRQSTEDGRSTSLVHATVTIGPITVEQDLTEGGEASDLCPKSELSGEWPEPFALLRALKSQQRTKWRTLVVRSVPRLVGERPSNPPPTYPTRLPPLCYEPSPAPRRTRFPRPRHTPGSHSGALQHTHRHEPPRRSGIRGQSCATASWSSRWRAFSAFSASAPSASRCFLSRLRCEAFV